MPNFEDGKNYKIVCNIIDECYIGSTTEPTLARRLAGHVKSCKAWKAGKHHKTSSFDIIDRGDYKIMLIEYFPCKTRDELTAREGQIIRQFKSGYACVNVRIDGRTKQAYYQDNKEKMKANVNEYRINNIDKIKEYKKEYRVKNIEKLSHVNIEYKQRNKEIIREKDKQYRLDNKEAIKERDRIYREKNKEKYSEKAKEKIICVCGSCFRKSDKPRHERTNKHQDYLKAQMETDH